MQLSESYINNLKRLSGLILNEEQVNFNAVGGRSSRGTVGYFI